MQAENKCCECNSNDKNGVSDVKEPFPAVHLESINKIIKKEGYVKHEVVKRMISTDGGNYLGDLYEVDIEGETLNGKKETSIFIKNIISDENNTIFSVKEAYFKECFTYKELSKIFHALQSGGKIPVEERFNMAKSYEATNTEAIFLENLTKQGYKTLHRMDVMPLKFAELAVQQIAKFHALGYVLQIKKPDYFNNSIKTLKQFFIFNEDWKKFIGNLCSISSEALNDESKRKVETFVSKIFEKFPLYAEDTSLPGCTICHGDYRVNNILVKNGELTKVVPVDYQLLYYGCPLNDFFYLIFNGSDKEFRRKHLDDLKNLYYEELIKFLDFFDVDANEIYPRKEFERQYKERLDMGLMFALYCTPFIFTVKEQIPDIGKDDLTKLNFVLDTRFQERIQGIVDDFIEWGYL